ncbi:MAG TPA: TorF family putative porin [Novimethylophilus sp.]|uniref:TorF family putative porin n=1 Tax=Novimethylophilus sp. TaxID=2137426 RepID=UPI002F3F89A7
MRKFLMITGLLGAGFTLSATVMAEDAAKAAPAEAAPAAAAPAPNWTFPGSISVVSDYIWRGQTQTWGKPAAQLGIEADHASGAYAGFWGSNVSSHWLPNANVEMDFYGGIRNSFATDFKYDVGLIYVYYPDANFDKAPAFQPPLGKYKSSKLNTAELYGSLGWKWFSVKAGTTLTKFYGWNVDNSGSATAVGVGNAPSFFGSRAGVDTKGSTRYSTYVQGNVSYDVAPGWNVAGEIGHQMIADSTGLDWTWYKVGATKSWDGGWSVNGAVSGTSGSNAYSNFASFDNANNHKEIDKTKFLLTLTKSF